MRKPVAVNRVVFMSVLAAVEGETGCDSLSALHSDISSLYNKNDGVDEDIPANISPSIVKRYIEDEGIEIKTTPGKKGSRSKQELLFDVLNDAIQKAESEGDFEKRTKSLYEAIAREYNRHDDNDVQTTSGVVRRTITERGMTLSTPMGKRGRVSNNVTEFVPSDEVMGMIQSLIESGAEFSVEPTESGANVKFSRDVAEQLAS